MLRHEWQDKNSVESENITQHLKDTHVEGRLELQAGETMEFMFRHFDSRNSILTTRAIKIGNVCFEMVSTFTLASLDLPNNDYICEKS